ncbi:hypothetical protein FJ950_27070 [Mesorhizobium sp. B2-3-14]|uniref:hypothetical protein n=1 Tax=Mesorhizobium sp. B2-3-14 TaxID=2589950 RepID=UPI001128A08F|nr:hypothetical protein [Mesorhizobium sp. B2-3-14]TPL79879.1 hypothetical protein FJ950_27070 [Mesorhizobium sp. B2-3-14]
MKFLSSMAAGLISTVALSSAVPVDAAPIFVPQAQSAQSGVIQIRDGARWRHHWGGGNYGRYRGYYGHGYYRPGYGGYDDDLFPGLIAGALIGSYFGGGYYGGGYYADP